MAGLRWVTLPDAERDAFLEPGGTGVLSFTTENDEPPASLPVSYGYATDDGAFYFRLSFPPESNKSDRIDDPVSFVVAEETDDGWRSVVATGSLEELAGHPYDSSAVQRMWAVDIPTVDIFDRPRDEIEFADFRLIPTSVTGRKSAPE
ncbi:pyridoxamine 5'-phosphate oxidase family protein [Salinadaptatus halalkaliphilus]|uniref:Pyridoxamine 5'-phosphate oxidase family protein n=1 Tax=Salinadaptatus halalkaliphilus TaxID=2419781 RepID=A0A4S3TNP6_9EURY|nr:pyridoxamine 5'-phosphate oxidase family protein [Salinadaptatus halalkaliphilus]THE65944.1 pyridoxamine 5'-phosphate oxidase family protein [Salinadaptatus halalkaliphilus]